MRAHKSRRRRLETIERLVVAHTSKKIRLQTNKPESRNAFSKVECKHWTPVAVLTMHAITCFIYYFNDLRKLIEIYIYARKKHPFTSYPAAKHPLQTRDRNEWPFFYCVARASTLTPAITCSLTLPLFIIYLLYIIYHHTSVYFFLILLLFCFLYLFYNLDPSQRMHLQHVEKL